MHLPALATEGSTVGHSTAGTTAHARRRPGKKHERVPRGCRARGADRGRAQHSPSTDFVPPTRGAAYAPASPVTHTAQCTHGPHGALAAARWCLWRTLGRRSIERSRFFRYGTLPKLPSHLPVRGNGRRDSAAVWPVPLAHLPSTEVPRNWAVGRAGTRTSSSRGCGAPSRATPTQP